MVKVLEKWMPSTLQELSDAVDEMKRMAYEYGHGDHDTVYVCVRDFTLTETTLSDGSKVLDLKVRENK